jgi:hypothetical protein
MAAEAKSSAAVVQSRQPVHAAAPLAEVNSYGSPLEVITPSMSLLDQAAILFPGNAVTQAEFLEQARAVDRPSPSSNIGIQPRALPVVLAPFVAILAKCVWGALAGAAVNEIITLVHQGKQSDAQGRVYSAVGGCITGVIPPFLRPLAQKVQNEFAGAVLWVIVQLGPKA